MTEFVRDSLFDNLLKTRYPLTYYLSRQQKFVEISLSDLSNGCETNVIRTRKTPHPSFYSKAETVDREASEFYDTRNGINSDQDHNNAENPSSESDEDTIQEYDARPVSENCIKKVY